MAYSNFTLNRLRQEHQLIILEQSGLFVGAPPAAISDWLRLTLTTHTDVALRSGSEKARSELLITPVLMEVYQQSRGGSFAQAIFCIGFKPRHPRVRGKRLFPICDRNNDAERKTPNVWRGHHNARARFADLIANAGFKTHTPDFSLFQHFRHGSFSLPDSRKTLHHPMP